MINGIPQNPSCTDIERAILCSLMRDRDKLLKHSTDIKPEYFYDSMHREVYSFMQESSSVDYPILCDRFPDKTHDIMAIMEVADYCNLDPFIKILRDRYERRVMIDASLKIIERAESDYEASAKVISEEGISSLILDAATNEKPELIKEIAPRLFENLEIIMRGEGIKTGLTDIDDIMGAIQAGEYIILAGRPSMGKTALGLCIARKLAKQGLSPLIFSIETSKETMCGRIIFGDAGTSYDKILRGDFAELQKSKLDDSITEQPIYIDGTPAVTLGHVEATAENYVKNHGVNFLILDHVGLVKNKSGRSRHEELSEISKGLKALLQKLKIPGIIICQLSREVEKRNPPIPILSDLRESGSLEEDADKVLFIYREEYYKRDSEKKGIAEIIIAKNKNGRTGYKEVMFDSGTMNFRNLEIGYDGKPRQEF
jgi:replicative DNA helicase